MTCGSERLLRHCDLVRRMIEYDRQPARLRLAAALRPELAQIFAGKAKGPLNRGPFQPQNDPPGSMVR